MRSTVLRQINAQLTDLPKCPIISCGQPTTLHSFIGYFMVEGKQHVRARFLCPACEVKHILFVETTKQTKLEDYFN